MVCEAPTRHSLRPVTTTRDSPESDDGARLVVRVWLPDRPGALGLVASRIGAIGADIVGVDVLERSEHVAVDEFSVVISSMNLVKLLVREEDSDWFNAKIAGHELWTSELALAEVRSAILMKERAGRVSGAERKRDGQEREHVQADHPEEDVPQREVREKRHPARADLRLA